jgi:hypothetical protein
MNVESARTFNRRRCRGQVLVYDLSGGETLKGELTDLGNGGARLLLDRPLSEGHVVRLVFPRRSEPGHRNGRTIVGQVVHSRSDARGAVVGVAFGWDAVVAGSAKSAVSERSPRSWFGLLSRQTKALASAIVRKV